GDDRDPEAPPPAPAGQRLPGAAHLGYGEQRGQRDRAAHPGPAQQRPLPPAQPSRQGAESPGGPRAPNVPPRVRSLGRARITLPNAHIQNSRTPVTVSTTTVPVSTSRPTGP